MVEFNRPVFPRRIDLFFFNWIWWDLFVRSKLLIVSNFRGTFATWKTFLTEFVISGPMWQPGIRVMFSCYWEEGVCRYEFFKLIYFRLVFNILLSYFIIIPFHLNK